VTLREGGRCKLEKMIEIQDKAVVAPAASGYGPGEAPEWEYYSKCIHCGLCLNACPTYRELGLEMDSPRGRIYQIIQVERGRLPLGESFVRHIDSCLDCRACETACPSGVEYGRLVESARAQINRYYQRPGIGRKVRQTFFQKLLTNRKLLDRLGTLLWFFQRSGLEAIFVKSGFLRLFSKRLGRVAALSPGMEKPFFTERLGQVVKPDGEIRHRVAFFAGCIANLAFARLNDATVRVLARNGCEVVIPEAQGCCGALHVHAGIRDRARELAKQNIKTFLEGGFDYFITNAAGCGSVLKEYPLLFEQEDREFYERAQKFSAKVRDVTEFLAGIAFSRDFAAIRARATYQDPCHLAHAQHIRSAPRQLMAAVPGLELIELKESEVCCGSAGIYNVVQNEMADRLLKAKMQRVDETGAELILTANPGCLLQMRAGVARSRRKRRVLHVVELLDEAYRGLDKTG
jgi:glycolate oxidase iron-sulfur subunit